MSVRVLVLLALLWSGFSLGETSELDEIRAKADQGDASAQHTLGLKYTNGEGVPEDYKEAVKWYRLAADQGYAKAQLLLGIMYAAGRGVPQDYVLAYSWTNLAGANGDNVTPFKEVLVQKMTKADISKAQELTRQYIKDNPAVFPE
jgi:uncharacterized protein